MLFPLVLRYEKEILEMGGYYHERLNCIVGNDKIRKFLKQKDSEGR